MADVGQVMRARQKGLRGVAEVLKLAVIGGGMAQESSKLMTISSSRETRKDHNWALESCSPVVVVVCHLGLGVSLSFVA